MYALMRLGFCTCYSGRAVCMLGISKRSAIHLVINTYSYFKLLKVSRVVQNGMRKHMLLKKAPVHITVVVL